MVVVWSKLSHPNILQFFGVRGDIRTGQFSTVSEWMERGDILRYIEYNPANRFELVRAFTPPSFLFAPSSRSNSYTGLHKV